VDDGAAVEREPGAPRAKLARRDSPQFRIDEAHQRVECVGTAVAVGEEEGGDRFGSRHEVLDGRISLTSRSLEYLADHRQFNSMCSTNTTRRSFFVGTGS